jgi:hypothetical protein
MTNDITVRTLDDVLAAMHRLRKAAGIDATVRVLLRYAPRMSAVRPEDRALLIADVEVMLEAIDGSNAFVRH